MGLRARLALFFIAITVVPLTVAVYSLQLQIGQQLTERGQEELAGVRRAAVAVLELTRARAGDLAGDLTTRGAADVLAASDPAEADLWVEANLPGAIPARASLLLLVTAEGQPLASRLDPPAFGGDFVPPDEAALATAVAERTNPPGVLLAVREVRGVVGEGPERLIGWVATGVWTDDRLLAGLAMAGGSALIADGRVLAAAGADPAGVPVDDLPATAVPAPRQVEGRDVLLSAAPLGAESVAPQGVSLVLWSDWSGRPSALGMALVVLVPSVVAASVLGWLLAGSVIAPVVRAAGVARAVAGGDLGRTLEPTGGKELADLAMAFNTMSAELAARMADLERNRDQLRGSLARLGQTLSSSLDLNRTLAVVVETAMETLGAQRASLMLFTPERDALYVKVGRGLEGDVPRLRLGEGIAGWVAMTGSAIRLPADATRGISPGPGEPTAVQHLAVPMLGRGRVIGVLSLLSDGSERVFTKTDLDTMRSFATQASVAIENVMLHQEAQRLSVTDPLTGLWNFRYFQLQADRELESAGRFQRPLSLVVADIDFFKQVNDEYGHQVGDEVLIEVARRLRDSTRVPDVVARYGGEEFVVLLPGTDFEGALATAERIRANVGGTRVAVHASGVTATAGRAEVQPLDITCSVGVASYPEHGQTVAGLVRSADVAMYTAKRQGRNRVVGAGPATVTLGGHDPRHGEVWGAG